MHSDCLYPALAVVLYSSGKLAVELVGFDGFCHFPPLLRFLEGEMGYAML